MKLKACFLLLLLIITGATVSAQQQPPNDPMADTLFPPELIMQNQQAIGLTEDQKTFLKTELRQAQVHFTELQWKLQDEGEKLVTLLKQDHVDEQQVVPQIDRVLAAEREVKVSQIILLVRIKNRLTPEQQSQLQSIRNKAHSR